MTPYDDIFDRFLAKITDYDLAELADDQLEAQLLKFMRSALSDYKYATQDLTNRNDVDMVFNLDLREHEQEIISKFMIVHWLNPQILRLENTRNELGNKDFKLYSPANFLDKITSLKQSLVAEATQDMIFYYYSA